MPRPSLSSLRLFADIAQTLNFSESSRRAGLTQPALSRAIRTLEEAIGERVFERTTRTVSLTAAGEMLLPVAHRLLRDYDDTFAGLDDLLNGTAGTVVLGALPSFAASTLPAVLVGFSAAHPDVRVTIRDDVSGKLYAGLGDHGIDLAVTTPPAPGDAGFTFRPLFDDPCRVICAGDDPLAGSETVTWAEIGKTRFIAMVADSSVRALTDEGFAAAGVAVTPVFECRQLATLGALVAAHHGVSVVPESALPLLAPFGLIAIPLGAPDIRRTVGLTHMTRRFLTPAARSLADHIVAALANGSTS